MRSMATSLALALLALLFCAGDALAHGGVYRGPGGAIPPGQREPDDPTPVPPPPSTGEPPVTGGGTDRPGRTPDPVTPTPEDSPSTPGTPIGGQPRTAGRPSLGLDNWVFWYENNKEPYQALKRGIYTSFDSNGSLFGMGRVTAAARNSHTHATRALVKTHLIPALLWAMDPENAGHQDTESAAYIALAKVTQDPQHIELLQRGLKSRNAITSESAALALGLLRRDREEERFDALSLDRLRTFLFDTFEDEKQRARTRGFAALAIGLLGDQPTHTEKYDGAVRTTERLFELLEHEYAHPDLTVALLTAISLQPSPSVREGQRQILRDCVTKSRLYKQRIQPLAASYAALALGRIGDKEIDARVLMRATGRRRNRIANLERSAAISLGVLGRRASANTRVDIARTLLQGVRRKRIKDRTAQNFALISLAYLVNADVRSNRTDVLGRAEVGEFLLELTDRGRYGTRDFGALALGLICREIGEQPRVDLYGEFQAKAREILRNGFASPRMDPRGRAAFAVALGLARDDRSIPQLAAIVGNRKENDELRGYAAVALGHIGVPGRRVLDPIHAALSARSSEKLRRSAATALGMLHDETAVPQLLRELKQARSQMVKGQVVMALAKVGDERAIEPLIAVLKDESEQNLTRALACAGLGVVGDLEWIRSLVRLSRDVNYRAAGNMMNEVLSIL